MIEIRIFQTSDADAVLALAARLMVGTAPWRDPVRVRAAVEGWVRKALEVAAADPARLIVATESPDVVVGFAALEAQHHWSGEIDASIGELVVAPGHEGRGIGTALVRAATDQARAMGHKRIGVSTGAANERALALYRRLGFQAEDVSLSRELAGGG
jgi:ribosomal protein S18 acetylase RimI-like enzyme